MNKIFKFMFYTKPPSHCFEKIFIAYVYGTSYKKNNYESFEQFEYVIVLIAASVCR